MVKKVVYERPLADLKTEILRGYSTCLPGKRLLLSRRTLGDISCQFLSQQQSFANDMPSPRYRISLPRNL